MLQGEQQASLEAGQSLSSSLPALQQLQIQPGLDSTAHPAANPMTAFAPHTASQQQQMVAGQQGPAATPFAGVPLQVVSLLSIVHVSADAYVLLNAICRVRSALIGLSSRSITCKINAWLANRLRSTCSQLYASRTASLCVNQLCA